MSEAAAAQALRNLGPAHQALLRQGDLQFHFTPPPAPQPPSWWVKLLRALLQFLHPVLPYLFWTALALGVAIILVFIVRELLFRRRDPVRWGAQLGREQGEWRPEPEQARALLAEADALAGQGLYEKAAHLILLRSIEDIRARRPNTVRPSLTSRDIAALPGLPAAARRIFVDIAEAVERSLFGGRSLDRETFAGCRAAYEAFAAAELVLSAVETGSAPAAFSARAALALVLTGVFAFCAFVVLSTYAPDLRGGADSGQHALSPSAAGYAGAVRLMRLVGRQTLVNRQPGARERVKGGMVLTPSRPLSSQDLVNPADERLIVLPKWSSQPDPDHPGWSIADGMVPAASLAGFAPTQLGTLAVTRHDGPDVRLRLFAKIDGWPSAGLPTGPIHALQTLSGPGLDPLITDERGEAVMAWRRNTNMLVLADPDLINTQGLRDPATAAVAVLLLANLGDENYPLRFDVTLNGISSAHSLLKLAFEPPFLGVTLCLALAAALIGLQAWSRFGPVLAQARVIALGKTALVENGAGMIGLAKREARMAPRYVRLCRDRAIRALGAGDLPEAAQDAFLDRWAERTGVGERITVLLKAAGEVRTSAELTVLAQRTRQWRAEMTREPD